MNQDHYQTLGVARGATADDIKKAYRRLASKHHPDRGGDKAAFQNIQAAYDTLSDAGKRQQYDNPQPQFNQHGFHFDFGGGQPGGFDFNTIFSMFGQHPQQQRQQHTRMSLWVTLQDVAEGGKRTVSVGTSHGNMTIEIEIPLGISDGDNVQYNGIGPNGTDLIVNYRIHPHPRWERQGLHLVTNHDVSVWDCLTGGETTIRDILGNQIELTIPKLSQPNSLLRLKNRGLRDRNGAVGDLLVRIVAKMPSTINDELIELINSQKNSQ